VGKASSAKKAARVAQSSGKRKVRSQQGLVFPIALVAVLTLGLALVIYGRATNHQDLGAPKLNTATAPGDHWHAAYGIYICDQYLPNMSVGVNPDPGGIHTHDDGVIHIHPFQTSTTGRNARMGDFFNQTGLNVTSTKIELPTDPALGENSGKTYKNGDKCPDGKKGVVKALAWAEAAGTAKPQVFVADIDRIRFTKDGEAFAFIFVPNDVDPNTIPKPPSAARLQELGAADTGSATPTASSTTVSGESTSTTVAGSPSPAGAVTTTPAGAVTTTPAGAVTTPPATTTPAAAPPSSGG
jgi:hypothetical protein